MTAPSAPGGAGRRRTVWIAGPAVAALLLAGGILRATWPDSDDDKAAAAPTSSGPASVAASVKAAAATSKAPANPLLDDCLVGRWRLTSIQVINHFEGVDARFTGGAGAIMQIWPDGRAKNDYSKSAPLTATIKGNKYTEVLRGVETSRIETKAGRSYGSEYQGRRPAKITKNGRTIMSWDMVTPSDPLAYLCTDTKLTFYGNKDVSTDSYTRISRTP